MVRLKLVLVLFFVIKGITASGQQKEQNPFSKGYFILPIAPGEITSLSGCYGDIRINHFHAGLDVRTGGVEGKSVYAAAEGYVSRIKVMKGGYGNALYITHPNGLTTVYAHLKEYADTIGVYLRTKQYQARSWELDIELKPDEIPVKKGQLVAISGNTGGSAGPHLHFEIRDKEENALDPAMFGFYEIRDVLPPTIELISLKCVSKDARINGKFGIFNFYPVRGKGGKVSLPKRIEAVGEIAMEVLTFDKAQNTPFRLGVKQIDLSVDEESVYRFRLEKMSFEHKMDMNAHVNYDKLISKGQKIHKCYVEPNVSNDFYVTNATKGTFTIEPGKNRKVSLSVRDVFDNVSELDFVINGAAIAENTVSETVIAGKKPLTVSTEIYDHYLIIKANGTQRETNMAYLNNKGKITALPLAYQTGLEKVFIYDFREGLIESFKIEDLNMPVSVTHRVSPKNTKVKEESFSADFSGATYGEVFLNLATYGNELLLDRDYIPLKKPAEVKWKTTMPLNFPEKQKVYIKGAKPKYVGGTWAGNEISFDAKELGTYQVLTDFDPPYITKKIVTPDKLVFVVSDGLSGIKEIKCLVDNEWVLMNYEYKNGYIWSEKLDNSKPFSGKVELSITDNCNNVQIFETNLN